MLTIYLWAARRSGACITITGSDAAGADVKLANVDEIVSSALGTIAVKEGRNVAILASNAPPVNSIDKAA